MRKFIKVALAVIALIIIAGGIGSYFYWQHLKTTPEYSLALIIDAARRDDQAAMNELIDVDAVVDDFLPRITDKAFEIYGRGLPPQIAQNLTRIAAPMLPAVKDRARDELPRVIRARTEKFKNVPFAAIVLGADRYLDIGISGDIAEVKSKIEDRPLEVRMKRNGDKWQIVAVKDDGLATNIAQKIGQEIIAVATNGGIDKASERLGIKDLQNVLKQAEDLLR